MQLTAALIAMLAFAGQSSPANPTQNPVPIAVPPGAPDPSYQPHRRIEGAISTDDYPPSALRAGAQGRVVAELQVTRDGSVSRCMLLLSSGHAALDTVTCRLIRERFRYEPARREGRPLQSIDQVEINWVLPEG